MQDGVAGLEYRAARARGSNDLIFFTDRYLVHVALYTRTPKLYSALLTVASIKKKLGR